MSIFCKVQNYEYIKEDNIPQIILCKISVKNLIAFSTVQNEDNINFNSRLIVCDVVTPWNWHTVFSTKRYVTNLEWSPNGEYIVTIFSNGQIEIWTTHMRILNLWHCSYKTAIPNENIIDFKFFHNGKITYFHSKKKELLSYAEKFAQIEYNPTLSWFGCSAVEGCILLTSSGLVAVFALPKVEASYETFNQKPLELKITTHSIGLSRNFVKLCTIAHCSNGSLNIATISQHEEQIIRCYSIDLKYSNENIIVNCRRLPNLFFSSASLKYITHMKWVTFNNENILYIIYNFFEGTVLEQWSFGLKNQIVHKMFQRNKNESSQYEEWLKTAHVRLPCRVNGICFSKLFYENIQIYVILKNNSICVFEYGLKQSHILPLDKYTYDGTLNTIFVTGDIAFTNQILWLMDNYGQLYGILTSNLNIDNCYFFQIISLIEYCIVTGIDANDILMINVGNLDGIIEKITDNFSRQPTYAKHYYYSNFLSIKSNMCRVQNKMQDFDNLIILHSISITFKNLLRPADLSCQDKGPAENLSILLTDNVTDVDKVLLNLDAKDFTVEPSTLQSIQQLIQWVSDLALQTLNKLPNEIMKTKINKKSGYDVSRDIGAIGNLRELLVLIRIWGLLNTHCLPIYMKSVDNVDILAILFRLLTRLAQNISEPDELLADECCLLPTQVLIPNEQTKNVTTLYNAHLQFGKTNNFVFRSGKEPLSLYDIQHEGVVFSNSIKDSISNIHLGSNINHINQCSRCGYINNFKKVAKTITLKAWCCRWSYCHCGGFWESIVSSQ